MLDELKKTINAILYDRIANPLSSSILFSWCIWNWRIIYITLFVDSNDLPNGYTKLEYIEANYIDINVWLWYPLLSAIILITLYPFITEIAYRVWLFFRKRKNEIKEAYEKNKLLTIEQSIELRLQIKNQIETYEKLTSDKESEIANLKSEIEKLKQEKNKVAVEDDSNQGTPELSDELVTTLKRINQEPTYFLKKPLNDDVKSALNRLDLLGFTTTIGVSGRTQLTKQGKEVLSYYLEKDARDNNQLKNKYSDDPDFKYFSNSSPLRKLLLNTFLKGRIYLSDIKKEQIDSVDELESMHLVVLNESKRPNQPSFFTITTKGTEFLKASNLFPFEEPPTKTS